MNQELWKEVRRARRDKRARTKHGDKDPRRKRHVKLSKVRFDD
jgi:hypothetical protein